jgi:hypothetical protein
MREGLKPAARIAITVAIAVILGVVAYIYAYAWKVPDPWASWPVYLGAYALAVAGIFVVYRWWALLPAIVPLLVSSYVANRPDYDPPDPGEPIGGAAGVVLFVFFLAVYVAAFAVGLLLRRAYESSRARRAGLNRKCGVA